MNKKKIFWGIGIFIFTAIIVSITMPYLFNSKNLISKNNYDYMYKQVHVVDFDNLLNPIRIDNAESGKVDKLISEINGLSLKKTMRPSGSSNYGLSFIATYNENETSTYTKEVFYISFYKDNMIGFTRNPNYRETYYKIQNEEFDIKKNIEKFKKG
ncbi:hypothetical protein [Clostridium sp. CF012]|uniref:hypothetical protein n=1 Tax=Clostridium sp. CF012 TaxID=2843319 RepID=UPI001C0A9F5F|nr:hypothetical protein [Clostridium sp. CF012]MBU3145407.1 hypothetical protein [Clostridium sp. CF012]